MYRYCPEVSSQQADQVSKLWQRWQRLLTRTIISLWGQYSASTSEYFLYFHTQPPGKQCPNRWIPQRPLPPPPALFPRWPAPPSTSRSHTPTPHRCRHPKNRHQHALWFVWVPFHGLRPEKCCANIPKTEDQKCRDLKFLFTYLDDSRLGSKRAAKNLAHLDQFFAVLAANGMVINLSKCTFMVPELEVLGHIINRVAQPPFPSTSR